MNPPVAFLSESTGELLMSPDDQVRAFVDRLFVKLNDCKNGDDLVDVLRTEWRSAGAPLTSRASLPAAVRKWAAVFALGQLVISTARISVKILKMSSFFSPRGEVPPVNYVTRNTSFGILTPPPRSTKLYRTFTLRPEGILCFGLTPPLHYNTVTHDMINGRF